MSSNSDTGGSLLGCFDGTIKSSLSSSDNNTGVIAKGLKGGTNSCSKNQIKVNSKLQTETGSKDSTKLNKGVYHGFINQV